MRFKQIIFSSLLWRGLYFITVLLLNVVVSRYFQANGTGWIYYITNYFAFFLLVASVSLESGMTFFASKRAIRENRLATFGIAWSLVVSLLILLVLYLYHQQSDIAFTRNQVILFAVTYLTGILLTNFFCSLFYAQKNYSLPNSILCIANLLLIGYFLFAFWWKRSATMESRLLNYYFLNYLIQGVLLAIAYWFKNNLKTGWSLPNSPELKMLFRFSLFAFASNILFFLLYRVDYWFVKNACPVCQEGDLGNYIQVSKMGQMFLILPNILATSIFPRTAAGFRQQVNNSLGLIIRGVLILYSIIILFLIVTGYFLFPWVYGSTFNKMYVPFVLMVPGMLSLSVLVLFNAYNAGKDKVITNVKGNLLGLIIILVCDWIFIPVYGIKGAAIISSTGYTINLIFIMYVFHKEYKGSPMELFLPHKDDYKKVRAIFSDYTTDQQKPD